MHSSQYICVVDDSADYRTILQTVFAKFLPAYPVRFFESGRAFLNELPTIPLPSLILLDRHMPDLDGHQILIRLKANDSTRRIPIIMMSADATDQEIEDCYTAGVNSFIRKPMDVISLKKLLTITCHYWLDVSQKPTR